MKKRLLSTLLALCMVLSLLPGTAWAAEASGTCGDNLTWVLTDAGTLTVSGAGEMEDYFYGGAPWWDKYSDKIKAIVIESDVTSIGYYAFYNCSSLASVDIPDSVTSIGDYAFAICFSLASVDIPDSVTSIGDYVFTNCFSLTSVDIPNSVTSIGEGAFNGCGSLADVYYSGSEEQWNAITIGIRNDNLLSATIHYEGGNTSPEPSDSPVEKEDPPTNENMAFVQNMTATSLTYADNDTKTTINNAIYNLLFKAQFRPDTNEIDSTDFGVYGTAQSQKAVNSNWPAKNGDGLKDNIPDAVLGNIKIGGGSGCNSYGRFVSKYIYGTTGTSRGGISSKSSLILFCNKTI